MATTTTTFRKTTLSHAQKTVLAMSRSQYLDAIRATRPADKLYVGVCIFKMDPHSSRPSVLLLRRSASSAAANPITTPSSRSASRWRRRSKLQQQQQSSSSGSGSGSSGSRAGREGDWERGWGSAGGGGGTGDDDGGGSYYCWELPGGKVRDGDFCISTAMARRVAEQTGLRVVRVLGALQDVRRTSEVRILDWDDEGVNIFADDDPAADILLDGATLTSSTTPATPTTTTGSSIGTGSGGSGGATTPTTPTTLGSGGTGTGSSTGTSRRSSNRDWRRSPMHSPQLVLRRECLQLNYAVLVQSHDDLAVRGGDHDELVWASFSRVEALAMPEQLRTVVHQGLAFAGEYLF
ncbi:putative glycosidase CRH2 [Hypoxylon texense]